MTQMRVAIIEPVGASGGMDFWNDSMTNALADVGVDAFLITGLSGSRRDQKYVKWELFKDAFGAKPKWVRGLIYMYASLCGLARARARGAKIAHFHLFQIDLPHLLAVIFAKLVGMRVLVSAHDVGSLRAGEARPFLWGVYRLAKAIVVYSEIAKQRLKERYSVPGHRIFVAPHGHYLNVFEAPIERQQARTELGLNSSDFVLLFFGQIKKIKRLDLLISAFGIAKRKGTRPMKLLVAGRFFDVDQRAIRTQILNENLENDIIIVPGYVEDDQIPHFFAASDMIILPYDHIYQSGVLLLAMSGGVPVVTSNIAGMLEVVQPERTGLIFEKGCAESLSSQIIAAAGDRDRNLQIAKAAREYVEEMHSWHRAAEVTVAAYKHALR